MLELSIETARRIISHLKSGTTPIDCVQHLNVGNEKWYSAAERQLKDISVDGDSLVRFINGYYGDGKTHFLGMLRAIAFSNRWAVSYVSAENTPLHKFDVVYSEIIRNLSIPRSLTLPEWIAKEDCRGAPAILGALFFRFYFEAYRLSDNAGLRKERVIETIRHRVATFCSQPDISEPLGVAIRYYFEAIIKGDSSTAHSLCEWLEGMDARVDGLPVLKRIDKLRSRDASRGLSIITKASGISGVLILIDEAERIMEQSRSIRNKSYGVLRDLLDNADDHGGMTSTIYYVAATPEMFETASGFAEYDALRSRLSNIAIAYAPDLIDWRGTLVNLVKTPMSPENLSSLARKVIGIHSIARQWNPSSILSEDLIDKIIEKVVAGVFSSSKPRIVTSFFANLLELLEQNREYPLNDGIESVLSYIVPILKTKPKAKSWE